MFEEDHKKGLIVRSRCPSSISHLLTFYATRQLFLPLQEQLQFHIPKEPDCTAMGLSLEDSNYSKSNARRTCELIEIKLSISYRKGDGHAHSDRSKSHYHENQTPSKQTPSA